MGLSDRTVSAWVAAGRLHRRHRGVYAVGHEALSLEGRWLAAVLASGDGAVLSHRSAAALWGIRPRAWPTVDVTTTTARKAVEGITHHRTRHPPKIVRRRGIPVTTPERTLIDLADVTTTEDVRRALHQAQTLGLVPREHPPTPINGRRGTKRLGSTPDRSRSDLERAFLRICDEHGIPPPEHNARIEDLEVDFLWREERLVVEVDGWAYHRTRHAFENDRSRDVTLKRAGLTVLRFADRQIEDDGDSVAATVHEMLRR